MSTDPITVHPDDSLKEVVKRLLSHQVKALPVVRDTKPVGIITGGDLLTKGGLELRLDLHAHLPDQTRKEQLLTLHKLTAADIMSSPVQSISLTATVHQAARQMSNHSIKRLPVIDEHGHLTGIVSRVDILRTFVRVSKFSDQLPDLPSGLRQTVEQIMITDVATTTPQESLQEVLRKMVSTPLRRVVVVDAQQHVRGIVLDRDLVTLFSREEGAGLLSSLITLLAARPAEHTFFSGTAQDVMRESVFSVPEGTPITKALNQMLDNGVKRLIVTDGQGRLRGILDRDLTLKALGKA
jgi:CBS domain-containing protein